MKYYVTKDGIGWFKRVIKDAHDLYNRLVDLPEIPVDINNPEGKTRVNPLYGEEKVEVPNMDECSLVRSGLFYTVEIGHYVIPEIYKRIIFRIETNGNKYGAVKKDEDGCFEQVPTCSIKTKNKPFNAPHQSFKKIVNE